MKTRSSLILTWAPGLLVALVGAACVRLVAPQLTGRGQALLFIFGYLLVPAGLGLIAHQIHRRAVADQGTCNDQT